MIHIVHFTLSGLLVLPKLLRDAQKTLLHDLSLSGLITGTDTQVSWAADNILTVDDDLTDEVAEDDEATSEKTDSGGDLPTPQACQLAMCQSSCIPKQSEWVVQLRSSALDVYSGAHSVVRTVAHPRRVRATLFVYRDCT